MALEGVRCQCQAPAALYHREKPGTHCTGGWVSPRPVWSGAENLPPPGFDPRTVQPVASRYTDYVSEIVCCLYFLVLLRFSCYLPG